MTTTSSTTPHLSPGVPPLRTPLRALPAAAGTPFLPIGFLARLPQAMTPLGMLLLVATTTGSYAVAGLAVAGWSVGCAIGGPALGLLADRYGHRPTGIAAALLVGAAMVGFVLVVTSGAGVPAILAAAAAVGVFNPQTGSLARARWARLGRTRRDRYGFAAAAMAYEGAADETSFVLGPVLVSLLAGLTGPLVALPAAAALCVVAQIAFALHPTALAGHGPRTAGAPAAPLPWRTLVPLAGVIAAIGVVFGSTQIGLAALFGPGEASVTGLVYGALGVGSGLAGLLSTFLPRTFGPRARIVAFALGLAAVATALPFASGPFPAALVCAACGLGVAPVMISAYALAERTAPSGRGATVMTVLATAGTVGVAAGASLAGSLADAAGPWAALALPTAAAVLAALGGLLARPNPMTSE